MAQNATQEYGRYRVESEGKGGITRGRDWYVIDQYSDDEERAYVGDGKSGKRNAQTLAATLAASNQYDLDALPPHLGPESHSDDEWEEWAAETEAVPAKVAAAGNAPLAGYLKVVHRRREGWISNTLGVSEQTVRQYLSDLRAGRR